MKIFLDANIVVSVINKEYPLFSFTSRILSLSDHKRFSVHTSTFCLAIVFYFAEKKHKSKIAKQKIALIASHLSITDITSAMVQKTLQNSKIGDFEDGLEYYSAKEYGCNCIITEDISDFYFSDIEVLTSEAFFAKYVL